MFCRNCGKELGEGAVVCPACGKPVQPENPIFEEPAPSAEPVYDQSFGQFDQQSDYSGSYQTEEPKESQALSIVALCLGIASLLLCCCCGGVIGIAGIIVSVIVLSTHRPGRGMAIAGLVTSIIGVIFFLISMVMSIFIFVADDSIGNPYYDEFYDDFYDGFYDDYGSGIGFDSDADAL